MNTSLIGLLKSAVAGAAIWSVAGVASAGLVSLHVDGENDCAGFFTTGPGECEVNGSSLIAKFGAGDDLGENEFGSYASITGDEFEFTNSGTGEWSYDPGTDDPGVRYWVAKGGNGFNLFFMSDTYTGDYDWFGDFADDATRNAWLDTAQTVTSGTFSTPLNGGGQRAGLSHISFYNGASVPEPATLGMLGAGIFALGLMRRRAAAG